jgi:hypothetical protein
MLEARTTFKMMALSIMRLIIMQLRIMTLSIMSLSIVGQGVSIRILLFGSIELDHPLIMFSKIL